MESVINKLTEIENAASRILEGAANQKRLLDCQQQERIEAFDRELEENTNTRIQKIRSSLKSETDTELERMRKEAEEELRQLETAYDETHEVLSSRICEKLIRK